MDKNGFSYIWTIISVAVIAVIVVFSVLVFFKEGSGKVYSGIGGKIDDLSDYDNDGKSNMFD